MPGTQSSKPLTPDAYMASQGATLTPDSFMAQQSGDSDQPSAASRFGSSFARGAGVVSPDEGKNFFTHPVDTAKGMLESQGELGQRAYQEFKRGDLVRAFTHGVEYLLPGMGPNLAHAGDQLESGDTAGGIGTTLGSAVPIVAGSPEARGMAGKALPAARGAIAKAAGYASDAVDPDITGIVSPRLAHAQRLAGKVSEAFGEKAAPAAPKAAPPQAPVESRALGQLPVPKPPTPLDQSAPLGAAPKRGAISQAMTQPEAAPTIPRGSLKQTMDKLGSQIEQGVGASQEQPSVPLKEQLPAVKKAMSKPQPLTAPSPHKITSMPPLHNIGADATLPEGHTAVDSSALRSYKYDPAANEMHVRTKTGETHYVYGDVSPEEVQGFEQADSKGKAFQQIKSGHPLVAKIVNGKRVAVKPAGQ